MIDDLTRPRAITITGKFTVRIFMEKLNLTLHALQLIYTMDVTNVIGKLPFANEKVLFEKFGGLGFLIF